MRRHLLGILSVVLIVAGLAAMFTSLPEFVANSSWRIGLVLGALWLAMPQLQTMYHWFRWAAVVIGIIAAVMPRYGLILLPLVFLLWIFGRRTPASVDAQEKPPGRRLT